MPDVQAVRSWHLLLNQEPRTLRCPYCGELHQFRFTVIYADGERSGAWAADCPKAERTIYAGEVKE